MHRKQGRRLAAVTAIALATALAVPFAAAADEIPAVEAELETPAEFDDDAGGTADSDDPAIWLHPSNSGKSIVITAMKEAGLRVYSLAGREIQRVTPGPGPTPDDNPGKFNNVDLLYNVPLAGAKADLAVVSDRGRDQVRVFRINPATGAPLTDVTAANQPLLFSADQEEVNEEDTAYGLATFTRDGKYYAVVSQNNTTTVVLVQLTLGADGRVGYTKVRNLAFPASFPLPGGGTWAPCGEPGQLAQVEGMVVDAQTGILYAAQEDVGIWKVPATLVGTPTLVDKVREFGVPATYDAETDECTVSGPDPGVGGKHISSDVEGLTIYYRGNGKGYLLASSQGDNTFAAYRREGGNPYLTSFRVAPEDEGDQPDGSEECDGAMVLNVPLGSEFDKGLFVVQDGDNSPEVLDPDGEARDNTNFKFVEWDDIAEETDLVVDTKGWSPRR